ncbi:MAG: hypothetical protein GY811_05280 [Myxococcales bacterium]|nr:hypothetical protein [Myxococcales bacterium]
MLDKYVVEESLWEQGRELGKKDLVATDVLRGLLSGKGDGRQIGSAIFSKLVKQGLPGLKVGTKYLFHLPAVIAWLSGKDARVAAPQSVEIFSLPKALGYLDCREEKSLCSWLRDNGLGRKTGGRWLVAKQQILEAACNPLIAVEAV